MGKEKLETKLAVVQFSIVIYIIGGVKAII